MYVTIGAARGLITLDGALELVDHCSYGITVIKSEDDTA